MSADGQAHFDELARKWRGRARCFMEEAEQTRRPADMVRLTAMASTLEWAASDLSCLVQSPPVATLHAATHDERGSPGG
jgi:hypothetical protein